MTTAANPLPPSADALPELFPLQHAETQAAEWILQTLSQHSVTLARNADSLLARCLDYPGEVERLFASLNQDGAIFEYNDLRDRFAALRDLCSARAAILRRLAGVLESSAAQPTRIGELAPAVERLDALQARVAASLAWLDRPRPPVDQRMVEESRAGFARGEYEDLQEILQRLHSGGSLMEG